MTNYNERFDEILTRFADGEYSKHWVDERKTYTKLETKQAITSLIKELVEEAKPPYSPVIANPDTTEEAIAKSIARYGNKQIDRYETNLKDLLK